MNYLLPLVMIFSFLSHALFGEPIELGTPAPQLTVLDHAGRTVDLGQELSTGTVLVFFYPKAMTPGCTKQACSLRDGWDLLQERGVKIFGVSGDTVASQNEFRDKYELPFTLIADTDRKVSDAFGKGHWSRHAYIFRNGKLVWRDTSAATSNQAEEVLAALDELGK
jgi:peroxiredoxin Q/BCP